MWFEKVADEFVNIGVPTAELLAGFARRCHEEGLFGMSVLRNADGIVYGVPQAPVLAVPLEQVPEETSSAHQFPHLVERLWTQLCPGQGREALSRGAERTRRHLGLELFQVLAPAVQEERMAEGVITIGLRTGIVKHAETELVLAHAVDAQSLPMEGSVNQTACRGALDRAVSGPDGH
ncbi:hypothetical protein OHA84_05770 [Streptomyces sp. NBC_00513]|uniref:hypothetical protein n=1 Tax=unclassified Streptomyces TaxID=2593676 RepID=UPI0022540A61|nr:hypothetical protein [Streptomyces sp. NBC_00424]MCX5076944.1 hypothetical protein [Streptomyces sp. NBC_00424]WUD40050.1 hypothetical protein OHA84_05770 [Streptomyces sp. NBC_00513]